MTGSRSQAATNCTEEIFLISSTCASAILPHPTIAIFKLRPFPCNLDWQLHYRSGNLVFASFRARVQPNPPIAATKHAARRTFRERNASTVPEEIEQAERSTQRHFQIAKSCTPVAAARPGP